MSLADGKAAILRFLDNEERHNVLMNDPKDTGFYTTNLTPSSKVETVPALMKRINNYLNDFFQWGIGTWGEGIPYKPPRLVFGSNGILYSCLKQSGPGFGGAKNPITAGNEEYWGGVPTRLPLIGRDAVNMDYLQHHFISEDSGFIITSDGKLAIDFSQMPTEKFEEMLKSIRVPIWLTANKNFYVRIDGDDKNDGSENTADKAFKTVQAALNYISDNYNIGRYDAYVRIGNGTFSNFTVPPINRSTGMLYVIGQGPENTLIEATDITAVDTAVNAGNVYVQHLTAKEHITYSSAGNRPAIRASSGAILRIYDVTGILVEHDGHTNSNDSIMQAEGGSLDIYSKCTFITDVAETSSCCFGYARGGGQLVFQNSLESVFSGHCSRVWAVAGGSFVSRNPAYSGRFFSGNITGREFVVNAFGTYTLSGYMQVFPDLLPGSSTPLSSIS